MRLLFISSLDFSRDGAAQKRHQLLIAGWTASGGDGVLLNPQRAAAEARAEAVYALPASLRALPLQLAVLLWLPFATLKHARTTDGIFCFDRRPLSLLSALVAARLARIPVFHELTEHPDEVAPPGLKGKVLLLSFRRVFLKRLAGVTVISTALHRMVRDLAPGIPTKILPAVAEFPDAVPPPAEALPGAPVTFAYAGSLVERKDGILGLIRAFGMLPREHGARLVLFGYGSTREKDAVLELVRELGLEDRVALRDPVPQHALGAHLSQADALVLCRPLSRQALYGFPTKLAEYLATGRPVIVTITSDIGRYLQHGRTAWLVPPDDVPAFAGAMAEAATDADARARVGTAGFLSGRETFGAAHLGREFSTWITHMLQRGKA
ncbi:MAG: glycosyltransferase [Rhizobiales bacterium]|nr:glycosyltransferase [Hyphomicrobiales bacterium]